jgi:magnesium-transporting ATPase (P-type)
MSEEFRKFGNMYFLMVGVIMAIGWYSDLYESAITPLTTLGPLAFVVAVSLIVQGLADAKRHKSDNETNNFPCVILRRGDEIDGDDSAERELSILGGRDVVVNLSKSYALTSSNQAPPTPTTESSKKPKAKIGFQKIKRMDIRQGHIVLVKNREMVPADMILLASSGDSGSSYIETSSIDGETNLKLRTSPQLPKKLLEHLRTGMPMEDIPESVYEEDAGDSETLEQATKRVARFSSLAYPNGTSAMENPDYRPDEVDEPPKEEKQSFFEQVNAAAGRASLGLHSMKDRASTTFDNLVTGNEPAFDDIDFDELSYVAALKSEPPNPNVNTFSGLLVLPPVELDGPCHDISLGAENILLRGAVVRNTEWVLGLACFTGTDTKLVQNSFETPSKFSQLDILMNKTVLFVLLIMFLVISYLATMAVISNEREFEFLW